MPTTLTQGAAAPFSSFSRRWGALQLLPSSFPCHQTPVTWGLLCTVIPGSNGVTATQSFLYFVSPPTAAMEPRLAISDFLLPWRRRNDDGSKQGANGGTMSFSPLRLQREPIAKPPPAVASDDRFKWGYDKTRQIWVEVTAYSTTALPFVSSVSSRGRPRASPSVPCDTATGGRESDDGTPFFLHSPWTAVTKGFYRGSRDTHSFKLLHEWKPNIWQTTRQIRFQKEKKIFQILNPQFWLFEDHPIKFIKITKEIYKISVENKENYDSIQHIGYLANSKQHIRIVTLIWFKEYFQCKTLFAKYFQFLFVN